MNTIDEYLTFRYNICMLEYMYDYIEKKLIQEYGDTVAKTFSNEEKREYFYKMMHTNRTDFSKYKHGKKKDITKKVKETFGDNSDFKQFIEGTALIYEDENADYPDVPNIELSDHTCDVIKTTVKNTWSKAKATSDYTKFSGRLVQLCAWMINEICSQYLEGKKPDRYKELDDKFRKLEDISFEKLDECAISNLEEWRKKVKHVSDTLDIIIRYKKLKDKK